MSWQPLLDGVILSAGLIIAIGAQNAFVIRQGVSGQHLLPMALTCVSCDLLLISIGALGVGEFIAASASLRMGLVLVGIAFLGWYGVTSWIRAIRGSRNPLADSTEVEPQKMGKVVLLAIGFSLLNPHAIVDTVVLIGGLASQYVDRVERLIFTIGAGLVSLVWLFGLTYGARLLQNVFKKPLTARIFDGTVGAIMFWLMGSLAISEFFS